MASWAISASSRSSLAEQRLHHVLELAPLPGRHAVEQRLHLRRLLPELLEELVEAFHAGEILAPLVLEGLEVRLAPLRPLAQHLVEVAEHLAHPRHVLGAHVLEPLLHALHEGLEHLLLEGLHQLPEHAVGVGVHELVALQPAHPSSGVLGQGVERLAALRRHLLELALLLRRDLALLARSRASARRRSMPSRSVRRMSSSFFLMSSSAEPRS
jgi:hypothetical protein